MFEKKEMGKRRRPKIWLIESAIVMIFLFTPLSVIAYIYALRAYRFLEKGLIVDAYLEGRKARTWLQIALLLVIPLWVIGYKAFEVSALALGFLLVTLAHAGYI